MRKKKENIPKKKYSEEDISLACDMFYNQGRNMHEIAKYFGKNASTISRWLAKAKKEKAIVEKETERALKEVARKNALKRFDRLLAYEEMQEKTIERIMELIPTIRSIPVLTQLLEHIENARAGSNKQDNSAPILNVVNQLQQISQMQEKDYQEAKIII